VHGGRALLPPSVFPGPRGALVSIGVMSPVVALNFCYDVPVKLYSSHLLAMKVFLILPDLRRLLNLFVFCRDRCQGFLEGTWT
jgi:hypothetical protein